MAVNLVPVRTYNSEFDANLGRAKLADAGIAAVIHNAETILINPGSINTSNIKLMVDKDDVERAIEVLSE